MQAIGRVRNWALLFLAAVVLAASGAVARAAGASSGTVSTGFQQIVGTVTVPAGTTLQGDVQMIAGSVQVDGTLSGSVALTAGQVVVGPAGAIDGDVSLGFGQVTVQPGGRITGTVTAGSAQRSSGLECPTGGGACTLQAPSVGGHVQVVVHVLPASLLTSLRPWIGRAHWWRWLRVGFHLLGWLGALALALPVAAFWPGQLGEVSGQIARDPGRSALVGLGAVVLAFPVLALVAITIIGIPVAFAAAVGLAAAWFFGYVGSVALIGGRTLELARPGGAGLLWAIVAGSLLVAAAEWVPIVGGLVWLAVTCVGLGAVLRTRFGTGGWSRPSPDR